MFLRNACLLCFAWNIKILDVSSQEIKKNISTIFVEKKFQNRKLYIKEEEMNKDWNFLLNHEISQKMFIIFIFACIVVYMFFSSFSFLICL